METAVINWLIKESSIFKARKSTSFQILCCVSERSIKIQVSTKHGRKGQNGSHLLQATTTLTESVESRRNSSGTSSQDSIHCSSMVLFMSMFNDISCGTQGNERECLANAKDVSTYAKKFGVGQWSFIGTGSQKKWYSVEQDIPQGIWDCSAEKMLVEFAESGCPIFRATTPTQTEMCEEFGSLHNRSGRPDMVMGQSIVVSEIKTEVPLENDDPTYQNLLLQRYEERIKHLSQTDRVSKFCMDAGFISVVEIEQYYMAKDNGEQFYAKTCRENTLPRSDGSSQPEGWIQGNTRIGPDQLSIRQTWN